MLANAPKEHSIPLLVKSLLGYCSQVWAPQSVVKNILRVESIQRRATRFICNKSPDLTYRDRLIKLNLLPLNYWLEYLDLVFFYKCKSNEIVIDLNNYVNFCSGRTRRASTGLYVKQNSIPRTSTFRDSFFSAYYQFMECFTSRHQGCSLA